MSYDQIWSDLIKNKKMKSIEILNYFMITILCDPRLMIKSKSAEKRSLEGPETKIKREICAKSKKKPFNALT